MNNQSNKIIDNNLAKLLNKSYDYGFSTNIEKDVIKKGLNEKTVNLISLKKNEPLFLLKFRLKSYKKWKNMNNPYWSNLKISSIDYQKIVYYSAPKLQNKLKKLDDVNSELLTTFKKLGISINEQKS